MKIRDLVNALDASVHAHGELKVLLRVWDGQTYTVYPVDDVCIEQVGAQTTVVVEGHTALFERSVPLPPNTSPQEEYL
jgi:hypothetical protein